MDEDTNIELEPLICEIEHESKDKKEKNSLAKKFINLIGQGYKPGEAAKLVGTSIKGIMSDSKVQKNIKSLLETYRLPADVRRELARAGMNKIALDNLDNLDPGAQKLALDALKAIGSDTEVGINAPPQPGIQINVGNLTGIFESLDNNKLDFIDVEVVEPIVNNVEGTIKRIPEVLDARGIEELKRAISDTETEGQE